VVENLVISHNEELASLAFRNKARPVSDQRAIARAGLALERSLHVAGERQQDLSRHAILQHDEFIALSHELALERFPSGPIAHVLVQR